ncbi:MAG: cyanophycin synthetase [Microcella sp.]|uniref:glutamate ligase domain-containing protein n=1 Tax=Microcella sp. TaxID=1913979 RepID=UPI0033158D74
MESAVVVDDVVPHRDGTVIHVRSAEESGQIAIAALGDIAVEAAVALLHRELAEGRPWSAALARAAEQAEVPGRCERKSTVSGALLLDDTGASTPLDVRRSLSVLAELTRGAGRSLAVIGELETPAADWFDDHDALGRIIVRLDISQLIVVGNGARHVHNAAGLEGSWNGESILVDSVDEAYDVLRTRVDEEDVMLVTGASRTPLASLVHRLTGGAA